MCFMLIRAMLICLDTASLCIQSWKSFPNCGQELFLERRSLFNFTMESTRHVIILCNKECELSWYMVCVLRVAGLKYGYGP